MLQYLVILLDDTSVSYCHYTNTRKERHLIGLDNLKEGISWAMKENLMIQFVYPDYELPKEYQEVIETIDHSKIQPLACMDADADVVVLDNWMDLKNDALQKDKVYVWRTGKDDFFNHHNLTLQTLRKVARLNVVITDVETFDEEDFEDYPIALKTLSKGVKELYAEGLSPQINLLTDRMLLDKMNNCNAGWENITLAPNGKFYVCPAFYLEDETSSVGDLTNGLDIKNPQLYRLDHAPLCRNCDAYQCKRCIWLNRKTTLEVNTPSHEQCVTAHLERNASCALLGDIRTLGTFLPDREIKEISFLDPFDARKEW